MAEQSVLPLACAAHGRPLFIVDNNGPDLGGFGGMG